MITPPATPRQGTRSDYARDFAERRGIAESLGIRSKIDLGAERVSTVEVRREKPGPEIDADRRRSSMFDGLKLNAGRGAAPARGEVSPARQPGREESLGALPAQETLERDRLAERVRAPSAFEQAVDRYARAYSAADKHVREGLPVLEAQKQELRTAGQQLDQARSGTHELIRSALQHDPQARQAMGELSGRERVGQLVAGMDRERAALADPMVRADRFVSRWQGLLAERRTMATGWHVEARAKVERQMEGLAKSLERDPQVESILRNRRQDLGIGQQPARQSEGLSHELAQSLTRGRSLGIGR